MSKGEKSNIFHHYLDPWVKNWKRLRMLVFNFWALVVALQFKLKLLIGCQKLLQKLNGCRHLLTIPSNCQRIQKLKRLCHNYLSFDAFFFSLIKRENSNSTDLVKRRPRPDLRKIGVEREKCVCVTVCERERKTE